MQPSTCSSPACSISASCTVRLLWSKPAVCMEQGGQMGWVSEQHRKAPARYQHLLTAQMPLAANQGGSPVRSTSSGLPSCREAVMASATLPSNHMAVGEPALQRMVRRQQRSAAAGGAADRGLAAQSVHCSRCGVHGGRAGGRVLGPGRTLAASTTPCGLPGPRRLACLNPMTRSSVSTNAQGLQRPHTLGPARVWERRVAP